MFRLRSASKFFRSPSRTQRLESLLRPNFKASSLLSQQPVRSFSQNTATPVSWKGVAFMMATGSGLALFYQYSKESKMTTNVKDLGATGKPLIGGPFDLVDVDGNRKTDKDYLGQYVLLYFGFTYCPDICPTELAKMMAVLETLKKTGIATIKPVFISVDPERDTPQRLKEYMKNYTSEMDWLTGSLDKVDEAAKAYRCYYSIPTPDERMGDDDYLVDHSIFFYLLNREGEFLEFFGKNLTAPEVSNKIVQALKKDKAGKP